MRLGFGVGLGRRGSGNRGSAFRVSIGEGPVTTGTLLTATVTPPLGAQVVTYQWRDDGVNIAGRTSATYTPAIGTDSVADASSISVVVIIDGTPYTSNSRQIRYAAGSPSAIADGQVYTAGVDPGTQNAAASGANLTFTYAASGLPAGRTINPTTGAITGTPTTVSTGSATVTATDQYGRTYPDTFTWTVNSVPAQMAAPSVSVIDATSLSVDRAPAPADNNSPITSYDLRRSTDESTWTTVTGIADPQTVGSLTPATLYYVQTRAVNAVGAGPWSPSGTATTDNLTTFSDTLSLTSGLGLQSLALASIGPAESGAASYAGFSLPAWAEVSGGQLVIDTDAFGAGGVVTVRRTDGNGPRDLILTVAPVTGSASYDGSRAIITRGVDDPPGTTYIFTPTGGIYSGVPVSATAADLNALTGGQGFPALAPLIALTTDGGTAGELDVGDEAAVTRPGLRLYRDDQTPAAITGEWFDAGGGLGVTTTTYTRTGSLAGFLTWRETDGGAVSSSSGIPIAGGTAAINFVSYDTAGLIIDYTGTLDVDFDTAGFIADVS